MGMASFLPWSNSHHPHLCKRTLGPWPSWPVSGMRTNPSWIGYKKIMMYNQIRDNSWKEFISLFYCHVLNFDMLCSNVQCEPSSLRPGGLDCLWFWLTCCLPNSAWIGLEFVRIGRATRQHGWTSKSEVTQPVGLREHVSSCKVI